MVLATTFPRGANSGRYQISKLWQTPKFAIVLYLPEFHKADCGIQHQTRNDAFSRQISSSLRGSLFFVLTRLNKRVLFANLFQNPLKTNSMMSLQFRHFIYLLTLLTNKHVLKLTQVVYNHLSNIMAIYRFCKF